MGSLQSQHPPTCWPHNQIHPHSQFQTGHPQPSWSKKNDFLDILLLLCVIVHILKYIFHKLKLRTAAWRIHEYLMPYTSRKNKGSLLASMVPLRTFKIHRTFPLDKRLFILEKVLQIIKMFLILRIFFLLRTLLKRGCSNGFPKNF